MSRAQSLKLTWFAYAEQRWSKRKKHILSSNTCCQYYSQYVGNIWAKRFISVDTNSQLFRQLSADSSLMHLSIKAQYLDLFFDKKHTVWLARLLSISCSFKAQKGILFLHKDLQLLLKYWEYKLMMLVKSWKSCFLLVNSWLFRHYADTAFNNTEIKRGILRNSPPTDWWQLAVSPCQTFTLAVNYIYIYTPIKSTFPKMPNYYLKGDKATGSLGWKYKCRNIRGQLWEK